MSKSAESRALRMCASILDNDPHKPCSAASSCEDCSDLVREIQDAEQQAREDERERYLQPLFAREQPCGCVVCSCDDDGRCSGCGAKSCRTDNCVLAEIGRPRAVFVPSSIANIVAAARRAAFQDAAEWCREKRRRHKANKRARELAK